jgi:hypothetical protein
MKILPLTGALLLLAGVLGAASTGPSLVQIAEEFTRGKSYQRSPTPNDRAAGRYDCSTFVEAVLKKAGFRLDGRTANQINNVLSRSESGQLADLVRRGDPKIQGAVSALVDSAQGDRVPAFNDLKPGDIIQMWKNLGTEPDGHTGFVKSVSPASKSVILVGAHVDGVGQKSFKIGSGNGEWPVWFAVRPK